MYYPFQYTNTTLQLINSKQNNLEAAQGMDWKRVTLIYSNIHLCVQNYFFLIRVMYHTDLSLLIPF